MEEHQIQNQILVDQTAVEDDQGYSTEPVETSPEHTEAGDQTDFGQLLIPPISIEEQPLIDLLNDRDDQSTPVGVAIGGEEDEEDEWIDEDDGTEGDLLGLEYHPNYITNNERRRRKWDKNWEIMKEAVSELSSSMNSVLSSICSSKLSTERPIRRCFSSQHPLTQTPYTPFPHVLFVVLQH